MTGVGAQKSVLKHLSADERMAAIRHAQVWKPSDVRSLDLKTGPQDVQGFAPDETVSCEYAVKKVTGTPKFWCEIDAGPVREVVKVKYGELNGEVYGEVAATRLLWALGFGADRMYPVRVVCRGCPSDPGVNGKKEPGETVFDPAAIERRADGEILETKPDSGWSWPELDLVEET